MYRVQQGKEKKIIIILQNLQVYISVYEVVDQIRIHYEWKDAQALSIIQSLELNLTCCPLMS